MGKEVRVYNFDFAGKMAPAAVASVDDGPWGKTVTAAAGSPTIVTTAAGLVLTMDAQSEVQNLCVDWGGILFFDVAKILKAEFWASITASLPSAVSAVVGLASARNDTLDSVAAHTWFRLDANNNLKCESDDGVTDRDDVATGLSLSTTLRKLVIDFASGVHTQSGAQSLGGRANVLFSAENSAGLLTPIARATRFDLSGYSSGLQPLFQLQKTSGTAVGALTIRRVRITYRD